MTDCERERMIRDLVEVLVPRLSDRQVKWLHKSAAAMVVRQTESAVSK